MLNRIGISSGPVKKGNTGHLTSHRVGFFDLDMLPVGCHHSISTLVHPPYPAEMARVGLKKRDAPVR